MDVITRARLYLINGKYDLNLDALIRELIVEV